MTLLDIEPIGAAFKSVLATLKDLSRERKLTRKGGIGADVYAFCKMVEDLCARGQVITTKVAILAKGNEDPQVARSVFDALLLQTQQVRLALESLADLKGPYFELLGEEDLAMVSKALEMKILQVPDAVELKKQVLATAPGERPIKSPTDIAERLVGDKEAEQYISEIQQAVASLKARLGKEFDPGDGRLIATKPRKGR